MNSESAKILFDTFSEIKTEEAESMDTPERRKAMSLLVDYSVSRAVSDSVLFFSSSHT